MNFWHFEYSFDLDEKNRILYGKIYGVWKKATAEAFLEEQKEIVKPIIKKPWAKLIDLSNWKIAHQDVISIIGDLNRWCRENKMEWAVYVINQPAAYSQLMKMFESGQYSDLTQTFRTRAEAENFLIGKGYNTRKPNEEDMFK